jgi:ankyrin repeat protein
VLKTLVELSADIEVKARDGVTPLHLAAANGQLEAIKTLVQFSADNQAKAPGGMTPLHFAVASKNLPAAKMLLRLGAEPDVKTDGVRGQTPLELSVLLGDHEVARVLRQLQRTARTRSQVRMEDGRCSVCSVLCVLA